MYAREVHEEIVNMWYLVLVRYCDIVEVLIITT